MYGERTMQDKIGHTDGVHTNADETLTRAEWFEENIPYIDTPEDFLDRVYYFRWNNLLSCLGKRASDGKYEFLESSELRASYHTYIDCAQGAHIRDARWIRNTLYVNDYLDITPDYESYWNYLIESVLQKYYLDGDLSVIEKNYEKLKARFHSRDAKFIEEMGLYLLSCGMEGQEVGINSFDSMERKMTYTASFTAEGSSVAALTDNYLSGAYWSNEGSGNAVDYIDIETGTNDNIQFQYFRICYKGEAKLPSKITFWNGATGQEREIKKYELSEDEGIKDLTILANKYMRALNKIRIEFDCPVSIHELVVVYETPEVNDDWWNVIGGEESYRISGNSYMAAAANALSEMAKLLGKTEDAEKYAEIGKKLVQTLIEKAWDPTESFFFETTQSGYKIIGKESNAYTPWAFGLMPNTEEYAEAWKYLMDEAYFLAEYGITTVEQGHVHYMQEFNHSCLWNGPVWPHTFSLILTALSEHLRSGGATEVDKEDYYDLLMRYCKCHYESESDTDLVVRENHHPDENEWLAQAPDYNHSTFIDNILSGLLGIRPTENGLEIDPIVPDDWDYFCVEDVSWHGKNVTVVYDKTGEKYGQGAGFMVALDGKIIFKSDSIEKFVITD